MGRLRPLKAVSALQVGLPGTGQSSLVFDLPILLAHQVFLVYPFFLAHPVFLRCKNVLIIHLFG